MVFLWEIIVGLRTTLGDTMIIPLIFIRGPIIVDKWSLTFSSTKLTPKVQGKVTHLSVAASVIQQKKVQLHRLNIVLQIVL